MTTNTLNNIIAKIKGYFDNHGQINGTNITIDDDDFEALVDLLYPVVNIQYLNSNVDGQLINHSFKIVIGDLTNPNILLIDYEIISDCIQIAEDFFGWMNEVWDWDWTQSSVIQPFNDSNTDRVSGVVFTITISVARRFNQDCIAPHQN